MTRVTFSKSNPKNIHAVWVPDNHKWMDLPLKQVVEAFNPPTWWIKEKIELAGNLLGSVHFYKREDNTLRKMSYRLHVRKPSVAKAPIDKTSGFTPKRKINRKEVDKKNDQMTVLDANKVVRDREGKVIGRGQYRTVPLENVVRICNKGITYIIHREYSK